MLVGLSLWLLTACEVSDPPAKDTLRPGAPTVHQVVADDRAYGPLGDQVLDVVRPAGREPNGRALVWLHNGGWVYGDENDLPDVLDALVEDDGYTVFSVRYRLSGMAPFPAQVEDVDLAMRWLSVHAGQFGVDAEHLVAFGWSSGAHLALLSGLGADEFRSPEASAALRHASARPAGIVALSPPLDLEAFARNDPDGEVLVEQLTGCADVSRCAAGLARTRPADFADADDPMVYLAQGDLDRVVPVESTDAEVEVLEARLGDQRLWYDRVDSGPVAGRGHDVDHGVNLTFLRLFLDAVTTS